jgi:hypothetical protein
MCVLWPHAIIPDFLPVTRVVPRTTIRENKTLETVSTHRNDLQAPSDLRFCLHVNVCRDVLTTFLQTYVASLPLPHI